MVRIRAIVNDSLFAYDFGALEDFIGILNEHYSAVNEKSLGEMDANDLLLFQQKMKEKKK